MMQLQPLRLAAGTALMGALLWLAGCAAPPSGAPDATPAPVAAASAPEAAPAATVVAEAPPPAAAAVPVPEPIDDLTDKPYPPRGRVDGGLDVDRIDLWQRARNGFTLPDLDSDYVRKWEQWYARDPAYVQRMTERGGRYLFHILEEVQRRNMPTELALLPFIESAFNPQAISHARASGMWQFMPATGKDFELRQNVFRDDRRDVLQSTRAALDYLQRLNGMFNDWHLALAAYNWGQGNVMKALERNRRAGLPQNYESLRMPLETREYVPKLQAVKNIVLAPNNFGLKLPHFENHPFFMSVPIQRDIDVALAAKLSELPLDEFQMLNPQMNKPVILAAGTPRVLLPYDNANRFVQQLAEHRGAMATWTAWVAPRTLKVSEAAHLTGMNEAQLREVNHIPPRMLVKAGSTLLVPRGAHTLADVTEHIAENATMALAPEARPLRRVSFKAGKKGSTVAAVAKQYRVSTAQVAQWNQVGPQASFKPGQAIVVMLPAAGGSAAKAPTRVASHSGGKTVKGSAKAPVLAAARAPAKGHGKAVAQKAKAPVTRVTAAPQKLH